MYHENMKTQYNPGSSSYKVAESHIMSEGQNQDLGPLWFQVIGLESWPLRDLKYLLQVTTDPTLFYWDLPQPEPLFLLLLFNQNRCPQWLFFNHG